MKKLLIVLLLPCLMAFQCEEDILAPADNLDDTGLFGFWEIQSEVINGTIDDMLPKCCEFLEFSTDSNTEDFRGFLTYTDAQGLVNNGTFEVNTANQTITFIDDDNDTAIFGFSVDGTSGILTINFTEEGTNYTQSWIRID